MTTISTWSSGVTVNTYPSTTTTMTYWQQTTVDGVSTNITHTKTVTAQGGPAYFWAYPGFDSTWSKGTTNPFVEWLTTSTIYASETDATLLDGEWVTERVTSTLDGSIAMPTAATSTAAATTTSSAAATALSGVGYAGDGPGVVALAACFAAMGVALFGRRF